MARGKYEGVLSRGRKAMPMSGSREQFAPMDQLGSCNDIYYGRAGGWWVSKKKAIFIGALFAIALVIVGILVHYFGTQEGKAAIGPLPSVLTSESGSTTEPSISAEKLRLPGNVLPLLYRLKLEPYLEELDPDGKNFTFRGSVSIVLQVVNTTNKVTLHTKDLQIGDEVSIAFYNESSSTEAPVVTSEASTGQEVKPQSAKEVTPSVGTQNNATQDAEIVTLMSSTNSTSGNKTAAYVAVNNEPTTVPQTPVPAVVNPAAIPEANPPLDALSSPANLTPSVSGDETSKPVDSNETISPPLIPPTPTQNTSAPSAEQVPPASTVVSSAPVAATEAPASAGVNDTPTTAPSRRKRNISRHRKHRRDSQTTPPPPTLSPWTPPRVTGREVQEKLEMITFTVEPPLRAGQKYQLDITFSGPLRQDKLFGFYASKYIDANNVTRWMGTTQFEAPHAREVFPCFDEPAMKAKFEISIQRNNNMTSISNMPLRTTEPIKEKPGRVWDHYEVSPVMSTYLVAFIVAPSDYIQTKDTMASYLKELGGNITGPEFKIYARKQLIDTASYAASIGPRVLKYYEEYFNITYPLSKMHMAAIPDFGMGAMENWGLLTYREAYLLWDKESSSMSDKEVVALVVAHEIAHQWFGNLVTMKWWRDLWLNEGFATYMEYVGADHVEPTWQMIDKFIFAEQQQVMLMDSLSNTHPVSVKVDNPAQISEIFDYISYKKGAALIRMLNNTLTETVLRKGLSRYLNTWKYKNAEEKDLWEALTEETRDSGGHFLPDNLTVKEVMDTWTLQDGFPVLNVIRNYEQGSATLTQERFSLENSTSKALWYIPVSYATQEEMSEGFNSNQRTFPRTWLKKERSTDIANLSKPKSENWVLFNIHAAGYYRVNYDEKNWALLASHLMNSDAKATLSSVDRATLVDDAMNLARAGRIGYDMALNLTLYLPNKEKDYLPWKSALQSLRFLENMLRETPSYGMFLDYELKVLTPMLTTVGFEPKSDESQPQSLLRPSILAALTRAGHREVEKWAVELFKKWMASSSPDSHNPIPLEMRSVVYCTALKIGDREEWQFLFERFKAAGSKPNERATLLSTLLCTTKEWLLTTMIEKTMDNGEEVRRQDAFRVWRGLPISASGTRVGFNYIRNNWDKIYDIFGKDEYLLGDILTGSLSGLTTELDMKDVDEFIKRNPGKFSFAETTLKQQVEALQRRVDWHKKHYATIVSWLQENSHANSSTTR